MRVTRLRFKNLNSLVGEWQIDLTHPAYASDGIFAITGPTGAGKTTILDALCLALYGRTPRLGKITKGGNEIMSRQTGECFAEATFEVQTGRFRCHWSQRRAHRKPDGDLQIPRHEIANADSGEIFESRIKEVADRIESVTGMDFDRFTRSMLLAQGGFAAFLQAAPGDRAPILEQITGTEIYSRISIRVHERQREERERLDLLQAEMAGIVILDPEQEKEIERALVAKREEEKGIAAKSAEAGRAIAWLAAVDGLKKEIAALAGDAGALRLDIEAFRPDREKLDRSLAAASAAGAYATLAASRKQQMDDRTALDAEKEALPELERSAGEQAGFLKTVERRTVQAREDLKATASVLQKVRALDQKLADRKRAISESAGSCAQDAARIAADERSRFDEQEKRFKAHEALGLVEAYLREHARDEWLVGGLAGVEEQVNGLLARRREILQKEGECDKAASILDGAAKSLNERQAQAGMRKRDLEEASQWLQRSKDAVDRLLGGRLLREYRADKEALLRETAFLAKITELEEQRAKLEDGKPCPLCGAINHPFAEGNVPVPGETERRIDELTGLIGEAEDQEAAVRKLEEAESLARKNLTGAEKLESAAAHDKKAAEKNLVGAKDDLGKLQADFAERKRAVFANLLPLGIADIADTDVSLPLATLGTRLRAWQARIREKADIEKQIAGIDSEVKRLDAVIATQRTASSEKLEWLAILKKELAAGNGERAALYGDKNPDDEERRLHEAISTAEDIEKRARRRHDELQRQWDTARAHAESLKKRIDRREPELGSLECDFSETLASLGFRDEELFLAAMLPPERRDALAARARDLDGRQAGLKARQEDREARLTAEMARNVTCKSLEELDVQFKEHEKSLEELRSVIAGFRHRLDENASAKERMRERRPVVDAQRKECGLWENLHELIGSADGGRYRNFVQGLTFEIMIGHANRQLRKMTDRYLLVRDGAQPLDLNVVDGYQAGEIRSTKNLSGGESFIVSLSLALGLSHMASKNVRIDSLFLDEGFGMLDEETLDATLEALASLQRGGRLIGVISHMPALTERINTRILVTPQAGGRSRISGPGCAWLGG